MATNEEFIAAIERFCDELGQRWPEFAQPRDLRSAIWVGGSVWPDQQVFVDAVNKALETDGASLDRQSELFYERAGWPVGELVTDVEAPDRRGTLVQALPGAWVDRDRKPPMVRWHGQIDAEAIPWYRLRRVTGADAA